MNKDLIMVIDEGTTSLRAAVFNRDMEIIGQSQKPVEMICPDEGEVEQSPDEIFEKTVEAMRDVLAEGNIPKERIAAIGITNQRGTWALWNKKTGRPITNFITWMDTRSEKSKPYFRSDKKFNELFPDQIDMMPPWNFVLEFRQMCLKKPELSDIVKDPDTLFGAIDTWLIYKLTGGKSFMISSSSDHTGPFYVLGKMDEAKRSMELYDAHENILPKVMNEADDYGMLDPEILGVEIPIYGNIADQQSSLFSQGCIKLGDAKCTCGTGAFVNVNIGSDFLTNKTVTSYIAWSLDGQSTNCVEGVAGNAGTCLEWAKNQIKLFDDFGCMEEEALSVEDNDGVYFVPALTGIECANYQVPFAKGSFQGLTMRTKREHLVRAALEGIAFSISNVFKQMDLLGFHTEKIYIDGGVSKSNLICQKISNVTGVKVVRSKNTESTALGAAEMTAIKLGWMNEDDVMKYVQSDMEFTADENQSRDKAEFEQWDESIKLICGYYGEKNE